MLGSAGIFCSTFVALASADTPYQVVANITTPTSAQPEQESVTAQHLEVCPVVVVGGGSMYQVYPNGGTAPTSAPFGEYNWSLATVLSCGLGIPLDNGIEVTVHQTTTGMVDDAEAQLDLDQLTDTTPGEAWVYPDVDSPGTLPLVAVDGDPTILGNPMYYLRPWAGPGDYNAPDAVTDQTGTITIDVSVPAPLLNVSLTKQTSGLTVTAEAQVTEPGVVGTLPPSDLTYAWSFGDESTSTGDAEATAVHPYASPGPDYTLSVRVWLRAIPSISGTASTGVSVGPPANPVTTTTPGTGGTTTGQAPNGPITSAGTSPGTPAGTSTSTAPATPPTTTSTSTVPASPTVTTASKPRKPKHHKAHKTHKAPKKKTKKKPGPHKPPAARPPGTTRGATHTPTSNGGGGGTTTGNGHGGSATGGLVATGVSPTTAPVTVLGTKTTTTRAKTPTTPQPVTSSPAIPRTTAPPSPAQAGTTIAPGTHTTKSVPAPTLGSGGSAGGAANTRTARAARLSHPLTGLLVSAIVTPTGNATGSDSEYEVATKVNAPAARPALPKPTSTGWIAAAAAVLLVGIGVARELNKGAGPRRRRRHPHQHELPVA